MLPGPVGQQLAGTSHTRLSIAFRRAGLALGRRLVPKIAPFSSMGDPGSQIAGPDCLASRPAGPAATIW
jgi:hypothetical protein